MSWSYYSGLTLHFLLLGFIANSGRSETNSSYTITPDNKINIAVLTDISSNLYATTGYENLAAARLAVEDINANKSFLPGYHFTMDFRDDGCDREKGLKALSNAYNKAESKINAVIGISCSVVCELAGYLCSVDQWNIPVVSHSCSSDELSRVKTYPTFARLSLSVFKYVDSIIEICDAFEWYKVGLMVNNIAWYVKTASKMKDRMMAHDPKIEVFLEKFYYDDDEEDDETSDTYRLLKEQLTRMKQKVRVIIIVGYARDIIFVLKTARKLGMHNGHFAFITQEFIQADLDKEDTALIESIEGVLDLEPLLNKSDLGYRSFSERVRAIVAEREFPETGKDVANLVAAQMYDAVWLYARSVGEAVKHGYSIDDGERLVESMGGMTWIGKSGEIEIDDVGDRLGNVQVMNIQNGEFIQVGTWWMSRKNTDHALQLAMDHNNDSMIVWPGAPGSPPVACGRQYELCETYSDAVAKITLMALVCMAFLFGLLVRLYLYNRTNK